MRQAHREARHSTSSPRPVGSKRPEVVMKQRINSLNGSQAQRVKDRKVTNCWPFTWPCLRSRKGSGARIGLGVLERFGAYVTARTSTSMALARSCLQGIFKNAIKFVDGDPQAP